MSDVQKYKRKVWLVSRFDVGYNSGPARTVTAYYDKNFAESEIHRMQKKNTEDPSSVVYANIELHETEIELTRYCDPEWGWENLT